MQSLVRVSNPQSQLSLCTIRSEHMEGEWFVLLVESVVCSSWRVSGLWGSVCCVACGVCCVACGGCCVACGGSVCCVAHGG